MIKSTIVKTDIKKAQHWNSTAFIEENILLTDRIADAVIPTEPRMMSFILVALCTKGTISYQMDHEEQKVQAGDLLIVFDRRIIDHYQASSDVEGLGIILSTEFFQETVLNVSKNAALAELYCYSNRLTTLDVSYDTALRELMCEENQLIALDVSKNTALSRLYCGGNQLKALDVSSNVALIELHCDNSRLTALDVSNNKAITELWCHNNQIPMLDLRGNAKVSEPALWQQIAGQVLTHVNGRYQFDLSKLIPLNYMTNVTVSDDADLNKDTGIVSFSKKVESFVYQYDTGRGAMDVTITFGNGGSDPTPEPTATPAPTPTPAPNALTIVQQPKDVKVKSGSKAKFTVKAKEKNVTYQWFSKAPKGDWTLMKGETQNKLTVAASGANNGYQYRCLVKNREGGQAYSRAAKLTVTLQPPVIKTQPKDLNVKSGAKAKFSVKASGKNISYQW